MIRSMYAMPTGTKKVYPKGKRIQMTQAWKDRVRAKLDEIGKNQYWLEGQLKCGKGMVTKLLSAEQQTSNLVEPICELLGVPMPMLEAETDDERDFLVLLRDASKEERDLAAAILRMRKRPASG